MKTTLTLRDIAFLSRFDPRSINNILLWLDAADPSTLTVDGSDGVSEWRDKSGNNKHFEQTDSTGRPLYNSTNRLVDTTDQEKWLVRESDNDMIWDGAWTYFIVHETVDDADTNTAVVIGNATNVSAFVSRHESTTVNNLEGICARTSGNAFTSARYSGIVYDQKKLHTGIWDNDDIYIYLNGVLKESTLGTSTARSTSHTRTVIGRLSNLPANTGKKRTFIHEIIMYKRALTASERSLVEDYLYVKWGMNL